MKDIGANIEFDLDGAIIMTNGALSPDVDDAIRGFKGFGVGWDVIKNGRSIEMSRSEFEPDGDGTTLTWIQAYSGPLGNKTLYDYWFTSPLYRPLDMPIEPYNAVMAGSGDRPFVGPFAADFSHTRVQFRIGSPVNPTDYDVPPLSYLTRSLYVNHSGGYTGSITSVAYDGGDTDISGHEPEADSLVGRKVKINNTTVEITANTTTTISFEATDFGTIADNAEIKPADTIQFPMSRPYIRLIVSGRRALPPKTAALPCIDSTLQTMNLADIAKTYLTAREGGRAFAYGANWIYRGSDAVNDADGRAKVECDTIAFLSLIGMTYAKSPYTTLTENATADFDTKMAAWYASADSSVAPWHSETEELAIQSGGIWVNGLGGRIVDQGAMAWWFWDNGWVFRPEKDGLLDLSQLRSGDLVLFRRAPSTFFDNVGHIGIIDVDADGTIYVIHATEGAWTCGQVIVRSELTEEFFQIAPGRYRPEDMYFARIPYGSTGKVEGSYYPPEEADDDE